MKGSDNNTTYQIDSKYNNNIKPSARLINPLAGGLTDSKSPHSLSMKHFWSGFGSLMCINLANIIVTHSYNEKIVFVFYIYLVSQVVQLALSYCTFRRPLRANLVLLFGYASVHLIITDPTLYSSFMDLDSSPVSSLQQLLLLTVLFSQFIERKFVLTLSLVFALISLGLLINSSTSIPRNIIEFFILLTLDLYTFVIKKSSPTTSQTKDDSNVTPLEEILDLLTNSVTLVNYIGDNCGFCRSLSESAMDSVASAITKLQSCKNIYSTKLEKITRNMDEDDRVFIEQNAHNTDSLASFDGELPINRRSRSESALQVNKLSGLLKSLGKDWNFNTFFLKECTEGTPLAVAGIYIISRFKIDSVFKLDDTKLESFLKDLESKYLPNPYHNSCHAADVMSSFLCFLNSSELLPQCSDIELLSGILSTLAHDAGHPAKNNRYLIITKSSIAIQYNDISVLENMHSTILFQVLQSSELLEAMSSDQWSIFRKLSIEMILATDMSKHFDIVETFKTKYLNSADITRADVRFDIFKVIIKAADIGHTAKAIDLHKKWCEQVIEEFFLQGDQEKKLSLPISMYCDRENTNIGKSQSGFIKNLVLPLFIGLNNVLGSKFVEDMCIRQLEQNQQYWENMSDLSRNHTFVDKIDGQQTVLRRRSSLPLKQSQN